MADQPRDRLEHVAWCGPVSLHPLRPWLHEADDLPEGYGFPLGASFVGELLRRGHAITIVTTQIDVPEVRRFAGDRLRVVVVPRRATRECVRDFFRVEVRAITAELRRANPQLVHAQWTYEFADAAIRARLPTVTTAHDSAPAIFRHVRDRYRFFRLVYSYLVVPRIRTLALPSPYLARQYRAWYLRRDSVVVPNGLSDRFFRVGEVSDRRERTTVVAITSWDERKNPRTLLRAFARAREELPALRLILMGDGFGPDEAGCRWAQLEGLQSGVDFRGRTAHATALRLLAEEADIFVHTTLEESFCMAVVEAMAAGVPVVAGRDSGAVPWLLGEGKCGVLVDVRSPDSVAAGIMELVRNPAHGTELAVAALKMARDSFSLTASVSSYASLYRQVFRASLDAT